MLHKENLRTTFTDQSFSRLFGISFSGGVLQYPPVFHERDIYKFCTQIKFFLRELHHICSSEIKTFDIWRHFYSVRESSYIFSSRRFVREKTCFTHFYLDLRYFLPTLEAHTPFYFILNKKYGSFLLFWVPSQLHTTKSRFCGSSQSFVEKKFFFRNQFFKTFRFFKNFDKKNCFIKTLRGTTEARFCRMKLLWCSKFQEFAILSVCNKIKLFRSFQSIQKISIVTNKNSIFRILP